MTKEKFLGLKYRDVVTDCNGLEWKVIMAIRRDNQTIQVTIERDLSRLSLAWSDTHNCVVNQIWQPVEIFRPAGQVA